jgi:hypothetical protein
MRFLSKLAAFAAISLTFTAIGNTSSLAEDGYELAMLPPATGGSITVFRINTATGQVSSVSGTSMSPVADPETLPAGKYRLYFSQTPDNKSFWLYRLETTTGRTWFDGSNSWTEIK